jgi:hypothetical protein
MVAVWTPLPVLCDSQFITHKKFSSLQMLLFFKWIVGGEWAIIPLQRGCPLNHLVPGNRLGSGGL